MIDPRDSSWREGDFAQRQLLAQSGPLSQAIDAQRAVSFNEHAFPVHYMSNDSAAASSSRRNGLLSRGRSGAIESTLE